MDRTPLSKRLVQETWICYETNNGILLRLFPAPQAAVLSYLLYWTQKESYYLENVQRGWVVLPTKEVLQLLGISRMTLYRHLKCLQERRFIEVRILPASNMSTNRREVRLNRLLFNAFSRRRQVIKIGWKSLMRSHRITVA